MQRKQLLSTGYFFSIKFATLFLLLEFYCFAFTTITAQNIVTVVGMPSVAGFVSDCAVRDARLDTPSGVAFDEAGNMYIADEANNVIRKVRKSDSYVSTFVGKGNAGYSGDGAKAIDAELDHPMGLSISYRSIDDQEVLYIADRGNHVVRVVTLKDSIIETFAGTGRVDGFGGDNEPATGPNTKLNSPTGVASANGSSYVYIADRDNHVIRKVKLQDNLITTCAGIPNDGDYFGDDGLAVAAKLKFPTGIALTEDGKDLYIADRGNHVVRYINGVTDDNGGRIVLVAGIPNTAGFLDGVLTEAKFDSPTGIVVSGGDAKTLYIADQGNHVVRKAAGKLATYAGIGQQQGYFGDGIVSNQAKLNMPTALAMYGSDLYIADQGNHIIRKVSCESPTLPVITASSLSICAGSSTTLSIVSGTLNDATLWQWYSVSCGGTFEGNGISLVTSPTVTKTYYVRGVGGCVTPGLCASITAAVLPLPVVAVSPANVTISTTQPTADLTATGALTYSWVPTTALNNNNTPMVTTSATVSTTYTVTGTSANGCTGKATSKVIVLTGGVGIQDYQDDNTISLYPNPNNGKFTLEIDGSKTAQANLQITNLIGQVVFTEQLNGKARHIVDLGAIEKGVYLIQINSNAGKFSKKMVVE